MSSNRVFLVRKLTNHTLPDQNINILITTKQGNQVFMPKIYYDDNRIYRKRQGGSTFFAVFLVIVSIALSVTSAMLLSNFITVGSFSFSTKNELKKNGFTLYAITLKQTSTQSSANSIASDIAKNGGAGYLYTDGGTFDVLASGYKEKSDAEKVLEKLLSQGQTAKIIEINVPNLSLGKSFSTNEQTIISNALCSFSNTFDSLYDLAVALDTKQSSESDVYNSLNSLKSTIKSIKEKFDSTFNGKLTESLLEVKIALSSQIDSIDNILDSKSTTPLTSQVKYCYFEVIYQQINLAKVIS